MKDYYAILGVPPGASQDEVKRAFRRLALQHHPDRNPGNEKQAEAMFKEINEAFSVLGDPGRRSDYDRVKASPFAGAGFGGRQYSQEQVFRTSFNDPAFFQDLDRMFREAGLRFDQNFVDSVFGGKGASFHFYAWPGGASWTDPDLAGQQTATAPPALKPGLAERFISWMARGLMRKLFGVEILPPRGKDLETKTVVSKLEAVAGAEKEVSYRRGGAVKRLVVKVPAGVKDGMRIRLRGMGKEGQAPGDLYVRVRVRG